MRKNGLEAFKWIAAVLVIAIHTSPLQSFSADADFMLTRVLARAAVPFFFMVTGYFVLPKCVERQGGLSVMKKYVLRILLLYLAVTALYIPIQIYKGTFAQEKGILLFVKDFFTDGTFYHLWYLPALIYGILLTVLLLRCCKLGLVQVLVGIVYLIGLFGDSYYGVFERIPVIQGCYDGFFQVFGYTRSFMAPAFLVAGYTIFVNGGSRIGKCKVFLPACLACMIGEALWVRQFGLQRHDSMYLFLPACMSYLFPILLTWEPNLRFPIGKIPMLIYFLHPFCIVLLRGGAKVISLPILYENSLLYFVCTTVITLCISFLLNGFYCGIHGKKPHYRMEKRSKYGTAE